eukprot:TRINITY_DN26576_c0_g1_i1.p1 TRINITY_DN26576_c0_g1~~TRINITY_DN26576_c0_g1_i1.p1  ORF type:complete len:677 (+),score=197.35 TRINITY_DN26576_c0_g1_i1:155-2185(+)
MSKATLRCVKTDNLGASRCRPELPPLPKAAGAEALPLPQELLGSWDEGSSAEQLCALLRRLSLQLEASQARQQDILDRQLSALADQQILAGRLEACKACTSQERNGWTPLSEAVCGTTVVQKEAYLVQDNDCAMVQDLSSINLKLEKCQTDVRNGGEEVDVNENEPEAEDEEEDGDQSIGLKAMTTHQVLVEEIEKAQTTSGTRLRNSEIQELEECIELAAIERSLHERSGHRAVRRSMGSKVQNIVEVWILKTVYFEGFFMLVVIMNVFAIGLEANMDATVKSLDHEKYFTYLSWVFSILFTLELLLKVCARGIFFIQKDDSKAWVTLDIIIVVFSWLEIAARALVETGTGMINLSALRFVRVLKVCRTARLARLVRVARGLRILLLSIAQTAKSLFWAMVLLAMIMFTFSSLFTQAAGHIVQDAYLGLGNSYTTAQADEVTIYWGSLFGSMLSLYEVVTGGLNWHEPYVALGLCGVEYQLVFLLYIAFTIFAVLNVVTGVFCNSAIESAQQDNDEVVQAHKAERNNYVKALKSLFERLDEDHSGTINVEEFSRYLANEEMQAYFSHLEIQVNDAFSFFQMIDVDHSHDVAVEEFVDGCLNLRGQATAFDIKRLIRENRRVLDTILAVEDEVLEIGNGQANGNAPPVLQRGQSKTLGGAPAKVRGRTSRASNASE